MLFGDWGTSRLYVLGLAFYYAGHASFWFMLAMSVLLVAVGWAYQVICRLYPDGGGVYSSCRDRDPHAGGDRRAAVVRRLHRHRRAVGARRVPLRPSAARAICGRPAAILLIGFLNYFGPTKAGTGAMVVAVLTAVLSLVIAAVRRAVAAARRRSRAVHSEPAGRVGAVHQADPGDLRRRGDRQHDRHHGRAGRQDRQEVDLAGARSRSSC